MRRDRLWFQYDGKTLIARLNDGAPVPIWQPDISKIFDMVGLEKLTKRKPEGVYSFGTTPIPARHSEYESVECDDIKHLFETFTLGSEQVLRFKIPNEPKTDIMLEAALKIVEEFEKIDYSAIKKEDYEDKREDISLYLSAKAYIARYQ